MEVDRMQDNQAFANDFGDFGESAAVLLLFSTVQNSRIYGDLSLETMLQLRLMFGFHNNPNCTAFSGGDHLEVFLPSRWLGEQSPPHWFFLLN